MYFLPPLAFIATPRDCCLAGEQQTNERPATWRTCTNKPPATRGEWKQGPAASPAGGHRQVAHRPAGGRFLEHSQAASFIRQPNRPSVWGLAPPAMPGLGPERISHDQPAAMTSNSQGTLLNYSISCQSEEEKTNRLLGLFLSDPGRAAVSYAAGSTGSLYKCQNPERDQGKKKSQQSYLQLSAQSCTTRPAKHKTCIKNILPTVDQNYRFLRLQQYRW